MKARFVSFTIICIIIHLFSMYYILIFNIIYEKSSESWIQGAMISLVIDMFVVEFGIIIIQAALRSLVKMYPQVR